MLQQWQWISVVKFFRIKIAKATHQNQNMSDKEDKEGNQRAPLASQEAMEARLYID